MNLLNASIVTLATGLSSCSMIKSSHDVVIDHNINININRFAIDVNHKFRDINRTKTMTNDSFENIIIGNTLSNVDVVKPASE